MKVTIIKSNVSTVLEQIKNEDVVHFTAMKCEIQNVQPLPFKNLQLLDLSYNNIEKFLNIPDSVQYLNLSHNNICAINDLNLPPDLKYLNLYNNPLTQAFHYRSKMIKNLKQICPNILYLDNVPIKIRYLEKECMTDDFEDIMGYSYHLLQDE